MIARYSAGVSFCTEPPRSSTQILIRSGFFAAISWTSFRASSSVVTPYGASRMAAPPGTGIGHGEPASRRAQERGAGHGLGAELIADVARIGAGGHHRADAVIGVLFQLVDDVLACVVGLLEGDVLLESDVAVRVDEGRDHGLAAQVDARGAGGRLNVAPSSNPDDPVSLDEKGGVLDRRLVAVRDQDGRR